MACTGPSKDYAYDVGERATEQVLKMLNEEYNVLILNESSYCTRKELDEWYTNTEDLKKIIQKIVWADHANGF